MLYRLTLFLEQAEASIGLGPLRLVVLIVFKGHWPHVLIVLSLSDSLILLVVDGDSRLRRQLYLL